MADILKEIVDDDEDSMKDRFLTFLIGEEIYGVPINRVMEIVGLQPITEMPETPHYIKGIVNLRGNIIPIMDVRLRFKKPKAEYGDRTCVIVIVFGGSSVGLIVDSVSEVLTIPGEDIAQKPELSSGSGGGYVKNIGKLGGKVILLIDCERLLKTEDLDAVSACP